MKKAREYLIAKCSLSKCCPKCNLICNAIAVKRNIHTTLYCEKCGAYRKHASQDDIMHTYIEEVTLTDSTPMAVAILYVESEKTMTR